jgi:hypothetical protein
MTNEFKNIGPGYYQVSAYVYMQNETERITINKCKTTRKLVKEYPKWMFWKEKIYYEMTEPIETSEEDFLKINIARIK